MKRLIIVFAPCSKHAF